MSVTEATLFTITALFGLHRSVTIKSVPAAHVAKVVSYLEAQGADAALVEMQDSVTTEHTFAPSVQ